MKLLLTLLLTLALAAGAQSRPRGHSHNDYERLRPLYDALEAGLDSVEADIFLENGQLLVAHDRKDLKPERTLDKLYLEPLQNAPTEMQLLIDLKTDGQATYDALKEHLRRYPIKNVILTGNRPQHTGDDVGIDATIEEALQGNLPKNARLISGKWDKYVQWKGQGEIPQADKRKLEELAELAHKHGLPIRLWASPDTPESWAAQAEAGLDWINTDQPEKLARFLQDR